MPEESVKERSAGGQTTPIFQIRIGGDERFEDSVTMLDPVPTGRQILAKSGRRPEKDYQLLLLTGDGDLKEIGLDETVDLRARGAERFFVFESDRLFFFMIDDRRFPWGAGSISESTLKFLVQVPADYTVWLERQGAQEDLRIEPGTSAPLSDKGVEVFFTGKDQTNAGDGLDALPSADRRYLSDHDLKAEVITEGGQKAVVLRDFLLPPGRFELDKCDLLVLLPSGYPDSPPDMFYADPWLKLKDGGRLPDRADQEHSFAGRRWQRWSRHNEQWRAGIDYFRTFVQRIVTALEMAQ